MEEKDNIKARLVNLRQFQILDTEPEDEFDDITYMASQICNTPISLISLLDEDRQWFKSKVGLDICQTPIADSLCNHAVYDKNGFMIIPNANEDVRFAENPLVTGDPNIHFYAGFPIRTKNGIPLGTLCVIDNKPNQLNEFQISSLKSLSKIAMSLMESRKLNNDIDKANLELEIRNTELERFAHIAAHDIKSPLNNIIGLSNLFTQLYSSKLDEQGSTIIEAISSCTEKLKSLVDGLLKYSTGDLVVKTDKSYVEIDPLFDVYKSIFSSDKEIVNFTIKSSSKSIHANEVIFDQIMINLISNSIKYNSSYTTDIIFECTEDDEMYYFSYCDNGPGIEPQYHEKVFKIFEKVTERDKYGERGNGIGLATVKKIIKKLGGDIHIDPDYEKGTRFNFTLQK